MNILKEASLVDKGFYQRVYRQFLFSEVWDSLNRGLQSYRFFNVERIGPLLKVSATETLPFLEALTTLGRLLPKSSHVELTRIAGVQQFRALDKKGILCHLHADWILALAALKHENALTPAQKDGLTEYLRRTAPSAEFESRLFKVVTPPLERSNIHTFNKSSTLIDLVDRDGSTQVTRLKPEQLSLIYQTKILRHIEIPEGFDVLRLTIFLRELKTASDQIIAKYPDAPNHRVSLKLRKIRRTKKLGLYVKASATALVDPRHTDSFWHELGHWVHSWAHPEIKKLEDCEAFAEGFKELVLRVPSAPTTLPFSAL